MLKPNETHFFGAVTQKAVIKKDGKILLVQYPRNAKVHRHKLAWGKWDMPGGRLNEDESVLDGFKREVFEEVGLEVVVTKILATGTFLNLIGKNTFFVIYECGLKDDNQPIRLDDVEVETVRWVTLEEFFTLPMIYPEYQEALKSVLI